VLDDEQDPGTAHRGEGLRRAVRAWPAAPALGGWTEEAACSGLDPRSFVDPGYEDMVAAAARVCAGCPVQPDCAMCSELSRSR
jgi:hypothetical protein